MKKLVTIFVAILFATLSIKAQALKDSWSLGFGGSILHLTSTDVMPRALKSYGGYVSLQRNFTEHTGLRLGLNFGSLTNSPNGNTNLDITTTSFAGNLDLVYYFMPCESFSPFMTIGFGQNYYSVDNSAVPTRADVDGKLALQVGFSLGALANLSDNWKLKTEIGSYQLASSDFDGSSGSVGYGLFGANSDAFMKIDFGVEWYFSKGEPSKICQLYDGLEMPTPVDYERLENIVKKYIPREVIKEIVVEKEVASGTGSGSYVMDADDINNRMLLMGVNFDFNSNKLKPEAYPILFHISKMMHQNPSLKVEVQGYTDNIGSAKSNKIVAQKRADTVKNYLLARGISAERVKAVGYGEENPIGDNKDADGRAMNRRIEFKVLD
ncbi:MAG: OmpA family protein [Bacteroidetes bacterium]|nr:OmpA family protein [Bacteroidota bacterium]MBU1116575.1 OmpA family protein [Bacteroidota bacterium]MBU1797535.1 OmpA family protein [Bacteroidota bacterium]